MLFWHLGGSLWLFRWIFRDPKVDVRFLLLGAVLADLIDLPLGTAFLKDRLSTGELWFHSLVAPTIYMVVVLIVTRRGRRRRAWMALGVGWLFHLLLDGMWVSQDVFLWPFFGAIPPGQSPYWHLAWVRALNDPWRWVKEAVGVGYLIWLWLALGLSQPERRTKTIETGRLPDHVAEA
ncbi:MAG TPA: metal-dependent hydrolase [Acidimicrobiia bacterium]|nr:metal-dependent hydrolase [Acidimicrobiia bacterium]